MKSQHAKAYISAEKATAIEGSRLPRPNVDEEWTTGPLSASCKGSKEVDGSKNSIISSFFFIFHASPTAPTHNIP